MSPRMISILLGASAIAALLFFAQDRFAQKAKADDAAYCAKVVLTADKPLDRCLPAVRSAAGAARRQRACDAALDAPSAATALFAIRMSCPAGVKKLFAERDAARGGLIAAQATIDGLIANQSKAVERAERRADSALKKADRNEQTIRAAPRGGDGLIACDADCLRALAD